MKEKINYFFDSIFFSYAQILFSNRRWLGAVALSATFIIPEIGIFGLAGLLLSNLIAILLKFDKEKIKIGFYGFNGILFGSAIPYFFEINTQILFFFVIFIIITFFISAVLEHYLATAFNLPGLSLPFIISLYIFLIFITNYNTVFYKNLTEFKEFVIFDSMADSVAYYFKSFAIIFFQKSILSGIMISVGILFFSRVLFINSIIAYVLNYFILSLIIPYYDHDLLLITSFNSILTSFALGGTLILISKKTIPLIALSTVMIIVFTAFFGKLLTGFLLPVVVLPFNLVVLSILYSLKFRKEQTDLVLLYFAPGSPEENFYYHNNRKYRFDRFKLLFTELPIFGEWFVSQGINGKLTHKQRFKDAWDFIIKDISNKEYSNAGDDLTDYFCYNLPVVAPLGGKIVALVDNVPDNTVNKINIKNNWGNTLVIEHASGLFSSLSHLKQKSIKVKQGDYVEKGDILAYCGNSGRSPFPHLHFQFQLTNKIGDKTYEFPISHFIEQKGDFYNLRTFDFPKENTKVSNIEVHKKIKKAFNLQLGDEFEIEYSLNDENFTEKWEVDVDINNQLFIKSDNNSKILLYQVEKVFYITNFFGNKKSALYFFYLLALKVPLMYKNFLVWEDEYPLHLVDKSLIRFISEFFLTFGEQIKSDVKYGYSINKQNDGKFHLQAETRTLGCNLFSFYKNIGNGELIIDGQGQFTEFIYKNNFNNFNAKFIYKEDNTL